MLKKVYHGSTLTVESPCLQPLTRRLDFGPGFYTTSDLAQARRWACIKKRRLLAGIAVVSVYDVSDVFGAENMRIKHFRDADAEWLDFVMAHRMGDVISADAYDVIRGPVANDTLYETLSLYERGILTHAETVVRLRTHKLADQIVFVTDKAMSLLRFLEKEEV